MINQKKKMTISNISLLILSTFAILLSCTTLSNIQTSTKATPIFSNEETTLPSKPTTAPKNDFAFKVLNYLSSSTYDIVMNPASMSGIDSLKYIIKELCSTDKFCRVQFFADKNMTQKTGDFTRTTLPKLYQLVVYDDEGKVIDLANVDFDNNYNPTNFRIAKTITLRCLQAKSIIIWSCKSERFW